MGGVDSGYYARRLTEALAAEQAAIGALTHRRGEIAELLEDLGEERDGDPFGRVLIEVLALVGNWQGQILAANMPGVPPAGDGPPVLGLQQAVDKVLAAVHRGLAEPS